jgi:hypothetical protein
MKMRNDECGVRNEEAPKMDDTKQRIAIAEACGWKTSTTEHWSMASARAS